MTARTLVEYIDEDGRSPFGRWFERLEATAAARVTTALYRLAQGNVSNVKPVGKGVLEYCIDFGPGYRIYFGFDGDVLVILLGGGSKKGQNKDVRSAHERWMNYKRRKRQSK